MAIVDLVMPKLGESITEATILKWNKKTGDLVKMDETLLEIATDKVDSEVPSTTEGVIEEILFKENDVVPVGTVIARIRSQVEASNHTPKVTTPVITELVHAEEVPYTPTTTQTQSSSTNGARFYSPLVLNIAANEGVQMTELEHISGTGNEGRVTKRDILQYIEQKKSGHVAANSVTILSSTTHQTSQIPATMQTATTVYSNNVEVIEM
ncbi:MAG TPA: E3 binding domain-containing protein, partial [Chitinophagaceae bacterium]|nr:E3 binding domain-containing protein [Chitinophagaceae bacterium]